MKKLTTCFKKLVSIFILASSLSLNAQFVTIPDPNFVAYLTTMFPSCMSGNQMDTTCGPITWQNTVSVGSLGISDLTGIQYFDGLLYLDCSFNNLTSLPPIPNSVVSLTCNNNSLTSINLPTSLTTLWCNNNNLTSLPTIPSGTVQIYAGSNSLTSLPALPSGLNILSLQGNNLTALPTLPATLTQFLAGFNPNLILPASLPSGLTDMAVHQCGLTSLPPLPSTLTFLDCGDNSLTSLPTLPANLATIDCSMNSLTSLPAIPQTVQTLYCSINLLSCLPVLPDTMFLLFSAANPFTCVPNYPVITNFADLDLDTFPTCNLSSGCPVGYSITGKTYFDTNLDCNDQVGENLLNVPVDLYQLGVLVGQSSGNSGYYAFNTSLGNFDVVADTTGVPFDPSCATPGLDTNITLTVVDSIAEDINFGFKCKPGYDMAAHSITQVAGMFFPGQGVAVNIKAGDLAMLYSGTACNTSGISGTVIIIVTGPVSYVSPIGGALTPSVAGNVFTYNISDFSLIDVNTSFGLYFTTDVTAIIGDQVCFDVVVNSSGTENSLTNNTLNHCFNVVNSYDPNIKEVSPIGNLDYPYNNWLTYTIHFQNTGNAPAMNIRVSDILDADLDPSTFRLLNSSHEVQVDMIGSNIQFHFNNIMLTDSTSNEPASHGYVQYKIMPDANLSVGTILNNTADIYFDFNSPITTNTTVNTITTPSGIESSTLLNVHIYPNPASEFLTIQFDLASLERYVQIIDVMGRVVQQQQITDINNMISLATITNGVYSIKIVENSKETVKKIVVQK